MSKYTFSDEIIAAIARSLQLSMLTGTDVVDHLRLLEVEASDDLAAGGVAQLKLTSDCVERTERNVQDLLQQAKRLGDDLAAQRDKTSV
jgi:hypothetical protein